MKIYRLLRNNEQMGCFTSTCLLQMNLQKYDLIWVEGESITWKYPSELSEFRDFAPKAEVSHASVVNSRKEKQITYFGQTIPVYDYKEVNVQYVEELDAVLPDVAFEFDYLVNERRYKTPVGESKTVLSMEENSGQRALDEVNAILSERCIVTDFKPIPGTPVFNRGTSGFSISSGVNVKAEEVPGGERKVGMRLNVFKNGVAAAIASLIIVAAAGYINLKL